MSAATPKVADYPFTTLYPNLGVVSVEPDRSFVIADIPGLIEGAAEGAGLGSLFLRHVQRTRLLLHLVDMAPSMEGGVEASPAEQVRAIEHELRKYDPAMLEKPRWLVLNKADLMFEDEARERAQEIVAELGWTQPWFLVSAIGREGTWPIMLAVQTFFDGLREGCGGLGGRRRDASRPWATMQPEACARATKNPAEAGFFDIARATAAQAACSALMRAVRRLLWRAALFLWIRPRALKRSRIGWATANAALAPAASLASIALSTFLTAVRSIERWAALRALRTTVCLARFLADLMLATMESWETLEWVVERVDRKVWAIQPLESTPGRPDEPADAAR